MRQIGRTGIAAALAVGSLIGAGAASATPVFIQAAKSTGGGVYVELRVQSQGGTRCKVNLLARVFVDATPIRAIGGHGRQTIDGCDEQGVWGVTIPARLRPGGRYVVCVQATNNNDYGQAIRHRSCRRFRG